MTKKCLAKAVWQFVFLMALILGGGEVCFGQQMQVNGDALVTGHLTVNGNTSSLGNITLSGNLNASGTSSINAINLSASGTTSLGATTASSLSLGGQSMTTWPNSVGQNLLVNSEFFGDVHPSQTDTSINRVNDSYNIDMWNGNTSAGLDYKNFVGTIDPSTTSNIGTYNFLSVAHVTANQRTAMVQHIESSIALSLKATKVSLSFSAKATTQNLSSGLTGGILCYTGTADNPNMPNIVSDWSNSTWGTGFYLISAVTTGSITAGAGWALHKLENVTIPSGCNNLSVVFWTPGASESAGVVWSIANPKLEQGASATTYAPDAPSIALIKLNRYVVRTDYLTGGGYAANAIGVDIRYPVRMRCSTPTINQTSGLSFTQPAYSANPQISPGLTVHLSDEKGAYIQFNNISPAPSAHGVVMVQNKSSYTDGYIISTCEM